MTAPKGVWADLIGQPKVATFLARAVADDATSHAYLFFGPSGSGKTAAARALACALLCHDDGCGDCLACSAIRRGAHPDVRFLEPEGAATYMVEQIRDVIHDVSLRPADGDRKVYVFGRAEAFNPQAANALLKTLEEPPPGVTLVLLSTSFEAVLPTIASRCQPVRFSPVPPSLAAGLLAERTGASAEDAAEALAAANGVLPRALAFLRSPAHAEVRSRVLTLLHDLPAMDGQDVLSATRALLAAARAPLDELKAEHESELRERLEFLGRTGGSVKPIEERQKRELTARERDGVFEILALTESWLRDCLTVVSGAVGAAVNADAADEIDAAARLLGIRGVMRTLDAVEEARKRVTYNVSPQLAIEAMLFDIQEVLICPR
jgi:DNA polymerase-3 subunit delta'